MEKRSENKSKRYTPNVKIKFKNGLRFLVEIQDEATLELKQEDYKEQFEQAEGSSQKYNMSFQVITIFKKPRMALVLLPKVGNANRPFSKRWE